MSFASSQLKKYSFTYHLYAIHPYNDPVMLFLVPLALLGSKLTIVTSPFYDRLSIVSCVITFPSLSRVSVSGPCVCVRQLNSPGVLVRFVNLHSRLLAVSSDLLKGPFKYYWTVLCLHLSSLSTMRITVVQQRIAIPT